MRRTAIRRICAGIGLAITLLGPSAAEAPTSVAADSRAAALALVGALDADQRSRALLPFEAPARRDWHYIPRRRPGVPLKALDVPARLRVQDLLRASLSDAGLLKVNGVVALEAILQELENGSPGRDPENFSIVIFGDPGGDRAWSWRFEGHHVSVGLTFEGDVVRGSTPFFLGANPAVVPTGPLRGQRLLATEEELALDLVAGLDEEERKTVLIAERPPRDVTYGPGGEPPPPGGAPPRRSRPRRARAPLGPRPPARPPPAGRRRGGGARPDRGRRSG